MMKYCKYFVPLVAVWLILGTTSTARAELGACCVPAGGCEDDQSSTTCDEALDGAYLGDGTTCATDKCPDCDCNGQNDVKMIADCLANCNDLVSGPCAGLAEPMQSACVAACVGECTMEDLCPTTNENVPYGNRCCDQLTGLHLPINDGWACTVDVCHADGSVSHTPDDGFCTAAHSGVCWTAFCDPPGAWADGCDWDYDVVDTPCTGNGVGDCTEADTCDGAGACDNHDLDNYTPCTPDTNDCTVDQCWIGACGHWPEVNGVLCGDPPQPDPMNPCDLQDTCGGTYPAAHANNGVCMDRIKADGPEAGCDDGDPCTTDVCTSGACDNTGAAPNGTACGGAPRSGECDLPDSCCSGVCVDIVADSTTKCGDDTGEECDADDYCPGGDTGCGHGNIWSGDPAEKDCADSKDGDGVWCDAGHVDGPAETECSDRDKCLAGVCEANHEPDTTACTDWDGNDCTDEKCDGAGNCGHPPFPLGTDCGDPGDTRCDNPDTCDGAGTCLDNHEAVGYMCRGANGECDVDDHCTDTQACPNDKEAAGTLCRELGAGGADTDCDVEEVCDGVNDACPTDLYVAYLTACDSDGEQCTHDYCSGGICKHIELADKTPCPDPDGDGDVCTRRDRCRTGLGCVGDDVNPCDDSDDCTIDYCEDGHAEADEDGCYHTYGAGGNCDLLVKIELTGSDPITRSYQKGCFTAEVYAMDASAEGNGLNCVFVDLEFGETSCPLSVMDLGDPINLGFDFQVEIDPAFPDFNRWYVEPPFDVLDFGGCTNVSGHGVGVWVPLGTVEIIAPNNECCADLDIVQATFEESSLIGLGTKVAHEVSSSVDEVCMDCWGDLYNCWDVSGKFINAGDLSLFAECWNECWSKGTDAYCAAFDYDMNECVNEGDLSFFATAWQEFVCAGGVIIPAVQMHCDGYGWGPGGPAGTANGVRLLNNGDVEEVQVPPASVEMIKSFGLTVPERLVAPPDNDRLTPKANKRPGVRSR